MWNKDKSISLSIFCVRLFAAILVAICFTAPWLYTNVIWTITLCGQQKLPYFLTSTYCLAVPAALALWQLHGLLLAIRAEEIFIAENVARLRLLSWCCIAAGLICIPSAFYYPPFLALSAAAAFMALIVRVIKNVFEQAAAIKNENDFTI